MRILDRDVCKAVSAVFFHRERVVGGEGRSTHPPDATRAPTHLGRRRDRSLRPTPDHASSSSSASSSLSSCSASFIPTTASSSVRVASATAPAYSASVGSGGADPPAARHPHPKECVAHFPSEVAVGEPPGREMSAGASGMGAAACAAAAAATASSSSSSPRCYRHLPSAADFLSTCRVHVMLSLAFSPICTTRMDAAGASLPAARSASSTAIASRDLALISAVISRQSAS